MRGSARRLHAAVPWLLLLVPPQQTLTITSSAFFNNGAIPIRFTCEGANETPPLMWSAPPLDTESLAILVEDPDVPLGPFTNWIVTNIPRSEASLTENGPLPAGASAGKNGDGTPGYSGPCPTAGKHKYHFHVYALDRRLPAPASRAMFLAAINGHVLAHGEIVGTYERSRTL